MIIKNGIVYDYANNIEGEVLDIRIDGDSIAEISRNLKPGNDELIDAHGLYVVPGLVDLHAHLRVPGQEHKETIQTGTVAAAKGGITSLLAMPNTTPPIDNPQAVSDILSRLKNEALVDVLVSGAMTLGRQGKEIADLEGMLKTGALAFSDDGSSIQDREVILKACESAKKLGALLIEHPECEFLTRGSPVSYGRMAEALGIPGQPAEGESLAILTLGLIAGVVGTKVHFTHISAGKSLAAMQYLKSVYPNLFTCDCTPHHIALSDEDMPIPPDTNKKMNPPLRSSRDQQVLIDGIMLGLIDAIATDHAPHSAEEKQLPFEKAPFGSTGFETFLPVTYTTLVESGRITMPEWIKLVSYNPAKILGIEAGVIEKGRRADIALFDPGATVTVNDDFLRSKSHNSAFMGMQFSGEVKYTICRGKVVYKN